MQRLVVAIKVGKCKCVIFLHSCLCIIFYYHCLSSRRVERRTGLLCLNPNSKVNLADLPYIYSLINKKNKTNEMQNRIPEVESSLHS